MPDFRQSYKNALRVGIASPLFHQRLLHLSRLVVFCGAAEFHDEHRDVLTNPVAVIEVLSPATEAFDRGEKFLRYQHWNPTLTDYLLVSQHQPLIEHFVRQPDGGWSYHVYQPLSASLIIHSIGCTLSLAEVYDRIEFPAENHEPLLE